MTLDEALELYIKEMAAMFKGNTDRALPSLTEEEKAILQGIGVNVIRSVVSDMKSSNAL
jgi:hypothetical protein